MGGDRGSVPELPGHPVVRSAADEGILSARDVELSPGYDGRRRRCDVVLTAGYGRIRFVGDVLVPAGNGRSLLSGEILLPTGDRRFGADRLVLATTADGRSGRVGQIVRSTPDGRFQSDRDVFRSTTDGRFVSEGAILVPAGYRRISPGRVVLGTAPDDGPIPVRDVGTGGQPQRRTRSDETINVRKGSEIQTRTGKCYVNLRIID